MSEKRDLLLSLISDMEDCIDDYKGTLRSRRMSREQYIKYRGRIDELHDWILSLRVLLDECDLL